MAPWQKEGFDRLEKRGYLPKLRELAMNMSAPFYWSSQEDGQASKILHNGSMCFVKTEKGGLGITANHVYQQHLRSRDVAVLSELAWIRAITIAHEVYPARLANG